MALPVESELRPSRPLALREGSVGAGPAPGSEHKPVAGAAAAAGSAPVRPPAADDRMARRRRRRLAWLAFLSLLAAMAAGYAYFARPWQERPATVAIERIVRAPLIRALAVNGRVAAERSVDVRALVPGTVREVLAAVGDEVGAGAALARLDDVEAMAAVAQAQAALEAGEVRVAQARLAADRARALGDVAPRRTVEDADLQLAAATKEVERLRGALQQVESALRQYVVAAPLSGTVLARAVEPGQVVDAETALFTVADLGALVVETDVDEVYAALMRPGLRAVLRPAGAAGTFDGEVVFASPMVDAATGGRGIKIAGNDPIALPIGLTVAINIVVDRAAAAISIPRSALLADTAGPTVLVLRDGRLARQEVAIVDWPSDRVAVTAGLAEGDLVVVEPEGLADGRRAVVAPG